MTKATGKIKEILIIVGKIQNLIGQAQGIYGNDRVMTRAEKLIPVLEEAFQLCLEATGKYDPIEEE